MSRRCRGRPRLRAGTAGRFKQTQWRKPESGVAKIYAPQSGVLVEVLAPVGTEVRRGDVLLVFSTEHLARDGGAVEDRLDRSAAAKVTTLEAELAATRQAQRDDIDNAEKSLGEQRGLATIHGHLG